MKSFATLVVVLLAAALLAACYPATLVNTGTGPSITGSGRFVEKTFDLTGFSAIDVSSGATARISQSDTPSVKVTVDDNAADYLKVEKQGDTLVIGLKNGNFRNVSVKAAIAMPELTGVTASGGSRVNFDDFNTSKPVSFNSSGGAKITGSLNSGPARVRSSGGADITLTGQGQGLNLNHSGGGNVKLGGFAVTDASVDVSGGSHSEINASGKVTGSVSGGGQLKLASQPASVEVKQSGGGSVVR